MPSMWWPPTFTSGTYSSDKTKGQLQPPLIPSYNPYQHDWSNSSPLNSRKSKSSRADLKRDECWEQLMYEYHRMQYGRYVLTDVRFALIPPDTTLWSQIWPAILHYRAWILAVFCDPRYAARPGIATVAGKTVQILFECLPRLFTFHLLG